MNAYSPHDWPTMALMAAVLLGELILGFIATRLRAAGAARCLAWFAVLAGTVTVERLGAGEPAGVRMVVVILALLWAMKGVIAVEARIADGVELSFWRWVQFVALWPGMQPAIFAKPGPAPLPARELAMKGLVRLIVGLALVLAAVMIWRFARPGLSDPSARILASIPLLPGLSLVLHFGVFNLIAAAWRRAGVDARSLFRDPLRSTSLTEFWGKRWNLAFVEMSAIGVYRPLRDSAGAAVATVAAFLFSGLLHEAAISVPAKAGFGGPMLYFVLHAALVMIERRLERAGHPIHRRPIVGRLWTNFWLVVPMPILFHRAFLVGCVWPIAGISG